MSVPVTLVPPPPSIPTDQVYTCTYTVITRGSQPLKRSIIYAGRVTAHWPAYSPVEKRLPRKVKLNERQTSPRREEKRREPPIPVHALPSPFHLSGASKRSRDDSRDDLRVANQIFQKRSPLGLLYQPSIQEYFDAVEEWRTNYEAPELTIE